MRHLKTCTLMLTIAWSPCIISLKSRGARFSTAMLGGSTMKSTLSWFGERNQIFLTFKRGSDWHDHWVLDSQEVDLQYIKHQLYIYIIMVFNNIWDILTPDSRTRISWTHTISLLSPKKNRNVNNVFLTYYYSLYSFLYLIMNKQYSNQNHNVFVR